MRAVGHLVVFLRAPRLGRVKSRLAAGIGAVAALGFYRRTSARLLRELTRDRRWRCHVALTPDRAARGKRPWRVGARWAVVAFRLARALPVAPWAACAPALALLSVFG